MTFLFIQFFNSQVSFNRDESCFIKLLVNTSIAAYSPSRKKIMHLDFGPWSRKMICFLFNQEVVMESKVAYNATSVTLGGFLFQDSLYIICIVHSVSPQTK